MNSSNDTPTPQQTPDKFKEARDEIFKKLISNLNYILVAGLLLINVLINMVEIKDGSIQLNDFSNYVWLDWLFWSIMTFIPAIISVVTRLLLQKEGIIKAKANYNDLIDEYFKYVKNDSIMRVRSEAEYLKAQTKNKSMRTFLLTLITSFFTGSLAYGWDVTSIIRLLINSITMLIVGFLAFTASYSYGVSELKIWYILEIDRLKSLEYDEMVKSGKYLTGGK